MSNLTESDYEYLKVLKEEILGKCKVCDHSGFISAKNSRNVFVVSEECVCIKKFKRYKEYFKAKIPRIYWNVTAKNFYGDKKALKFVEGYLENIHNAYHQGLGILFHGSNGNGKTSLVNIILKEAVKTKYSVYYTTLQNILNMIMDSFSPDSEKENIRQFLMNVDFLVIDEIGKEHIKKNQQGSFFGMVEFEELLRHREGKSKVNLLASNLKPQQIEARYGLSISSLFRGSMKLFEVTGADTRKFVKGPSWNKLLKGSQ